MALSPETSFEEKREGKKTHNNDKTRIFTIYKVLKSHLIDLL